MEEKILVRSKNGSFVPVAICFGLAALSIVLFFIVGSAVEGSIAYAFRHFGLGWWAFFAGAGACIVVGIILLPFSSGEIVVTKNVVYVKTVFSELAMPVEKITCIKKGTFKTITVVTASNHVQCFAGKTAKEIYDCLIGLINEQ